MKTALLFVFLCLSSISPARAGGGAPGGGATEHTQMLNNVALADQYAQQALHYQESVLQYETMIRNLQDNPIGTVAPNLNQLATNQARIMALGQDIGSNMSKVDNNFAKAFNNNEAASFGVKFGAWTNTALDALKSAMLNAGLQRENYKNDEQATQALVKKSASISGTVGGLQTLADLNAHQLVESQKLRDLMAQQQQATNVALAAQVSKEQALQDSQVGSMGKNITGPRW